jgi:hypothetical protein
MVVAEPFRNLASPIFFSKGVTGYQVYRPADGKVKMINENAHHFFLYNDGDFGGILEDMELNFVEDDVYEKADPGQVPKKHSCGNCGIGLLFTGSQSQQLKTTSQFAESVLSPAPNATLPCI